jgi:transposase
VSESTDLSSPLKAENVSTEVNVAPRSKRYTVAFKRRLIEEADRCQAPGELGALLRREGIFSSTLSDFRKQQARGDLDDKSTATAPKEVVSPQVVKELAASQREVRRLKRELDCATALLDLQKKVSEILGLAMAPPE